MHWTQKSENKERLLAMRKKSAKTMRKMRKEQLKKAELVTTWDKKLSTHSVKENGTAIKETPEFAYALGHIECWLETYSQSAGLPYETFASELGKVFSSKARR